MNDFVLNVENFKFGILDKVPTPNANECFLLYCADNEIRKSIIISNGKRYSAAEIRRGVYNRKAIISLERQNIIHTRKIAMKDCVFYFDVTVNIFGAVQDVKKYFFSERMKVANVEAQIRDILKQYDGKWDSRQSLQAQNVLETEIEELLKKYQSIRFDMPKVTVTPDSAAVEMVKSDRDKEVEIHTIINETDKKIKVNEQKVKQIESDYKVKEMKIREMALMMKNFGSLGPIVDKYLCGEMDGEKFYEYMNESKTNDMSMLNTALQNDIITQEEAIQKLNEILQDTKYIQLGNSQQLLKEKVYRADKEGERPKEQVEEAGVSLKDGDYL